MALLSNGNSEKKLLAAIAAKKAELAEIKNAPAAVGDVIEKIDRDHDGARERVKQRFARLTAASADAADLSLLKFREPRVAVTPADFDALQDFVIAMVPLKAIHEIVKSVIPSSSLSIDERVQHCQQLDIEIAKLETELELLYIDRENLSGGYHDRPEGHAPGIFLAFKNPNQWDQTKYRKLRARLLGIGMSEGELHREVLGLRRNIDEKTKWLHNGLTKDSRYVERVRNEITELQTKIASLQAQAEQLAEPRDRVMSFLSRCDRFLAEHNVAVD